MSDLALPRAAGILARSFIEYHPVDAARVLEPFGGASAAALLKDYPVDQIAAVAEVLADDVASDCVAGFESGLGAKVLAALDLDEAAALLRRMDEPDQQRLLDALPDEESEHIGRILAFPSGSAGSLMDPKVLAVSTSLTAGQALEKVRAAPQLALYYLYLVDESSRLSGVINLRELMLADPTTPLTQIMAADVERLPATADQLAIVGHPGWTEYHALPVVDSDGRFVGALRYETLRRLEGQVLAEGPAADLATSLGELYWVGLSGILQGMGQAVATAGRRDQVRGKEDGGAEDAR
ncbi:MAG: CBS domain-containing protein [Actinomycetota bacterium]